MSQEARDALASNPNMVFQKESQRDDIRDQNKTNTWLIEFLTRLVQTAGHPILITALNSDHSPGTWHNPPGRAVDCWIADWQTVGDEKIIDLMNAANAIGASNDPALIEVGLSGDAARCMDDVNWSCSNVFVEDWGDSNEHVHFAVGVPY